MRTCKVFVHGINAGTLTESDQREYTFTYDESYFHDPAMPPVSLTLPKTSRSYHSPYLFSAFFNILSEGENRKFQSRLLKIDEEDDFGILLATAQYDTIGAITVQPDE